jgi:hypothetical protein
MGLYSPYRSYSVKREYMRKGPWLFGILSLISLQMPAALVRSGTVEFIIDESPDRNRFDFARAHLCGTVRASPCSAMVKGDLYIGAPSGLVIYMGYEQGLAVPAESGFDVYSPSVADGWASMKTKLDSLLSAMRFTVKAPGGAPYHLLSVYIRPNGHMWVSQTEAGGFGVLMKIGSKSTAGVSREAYYWAYQDDGSPRLYENTSGVLPARPTATRRAEQVLRVDALGRLRHSTPAVFAGERPSWERVAYP